MFDARVRPTVLSSQLRDVAMFCTVVFFFFFDIFTLIQSRKSGSAEALIMNGNGARGLSNS